MALATIVPAVKDFSRAIVTDILLSYHVVLYYLIHNTMHNTIIIRIIHNTQRKPVYYHTLPRMLGIPTSLPGWCGETLTQQVCIRNGAGQAAHSMGCTTQHTNIYSVEGSGNKCVFNDTVCK